MKKLIPILLLVIVFASCEKEEPIKEVTFELNISDFQITSKEFGSLKSQNQTNLEFVHKYPSGALIFLLFFFYLNWLVGVLRTSVFPGIFPDAGNNLPRLAELRFT